MLSENVLPTTAVFQAIQCKYVGSIWLVVVHEDVTLTTIHSEPSLTHYCQKADGFNKLEEDDHNEIIILDAGSAKLWKTESQRWGSFYVKKRPPGADPFSSQRSCWRKPRSKCDVTEYGDRFVYNY